MTSDEAHKILNGKLVFGDTAQVAANKYLRDFEDAKEGIEKCCDACHLHYEQHELCEYLRGIDKEAVAEALNMEWVN